MLSNSLRDMPGFIPSLYKRFLIMAITNKQTARIKLWIGISEGISPQVWYNFDTENNLNTQVIIERMRKRILHKKLSRNFVEARFYDNKTKTLIDSVHGVRYGEKFTNNQS